MAYDDKLAKRIRDALAGKTGLAEKKMFGGVAFILNGNMACGVHKDSLIVRIGEMQHDASLTKRHVQHFDISGRGVMKGWILVAPQGCASNADLNRWINMGVTYAMSLPRK